MWYQNQNGSEDKPVALDRNSSKVYTYVRKDFELIPATEEVPAHWIWQEMKVKKEDWGVYEQVLEHDNALDDVYAAITELAELVIGE